MAAADSDDQSLWETLGVGAAYILWIVRGFWHPYFVPWYKKVPFFWKIADMWRSSKKTPSSAKYVPKVRPASVHEYPPPYPGHAPWTVHGNTRNNSSLFSSNSIGSYSSSIVVVVVAAAAAAAAVVLSSARTYSWQILYYLNKSYSGAHFPPLVTTA